MIKNSSNFDSVKSKLEVLKHKALLMKLLLKCVLAICIIQLISEPINAQQIENVTLQLKWKHQFQFAGYYAAIEKGYYKEVGLKVKLLEAVDRLNPSDAVFEGKAEFGVGT